MDTTLFRLLESTAQCHPSKGLIIYEPGAVGASPISVLYSELLSLAKQNANQLLLHCSLSKDSVILLHFDNHWDNIVWYWSVIATGCIPAISTPFTNDLKQRKRHLDHLNSMLKSPLCLTRESLMPEFSNAESNLCNLRAIETLGAAADEKTYQELSFVHNMSAGDIATLMLTSGSTGNAKAVMLQHGQMLRAVLGKSQHFGTVTNDCFLNWIGLDHVASLTETHLHAMFLGANQVHVQASDIISDPLLFLRLTSQHKVAYTFAPNFFLAHLNKTISASKEGHDSLDLSPLRCLISGGEANDAETVASLTVALRAYKANDSFIRPGFGMTETCAGCIYSRDLPGSDVSKGLEFSRLGTCTPGTFMRVTSDEGVVVAKGETGNLEVSGPVVFSGYYNNEEATSSAMSLDGWFKTGDRAFIDGDGYLNLSGRSKETIIINGIKYYPHEIASSIEQENLPGVSSSFLVVFSYRRKGDATEGVCVVYLPTYAPDDTAARGTTADEISKIVLVATNSRPIVILPVSEEFLQRSSIGKLSAAKVKAALERGDYDELIRVNEEQINKYRWDGYQEPRGYTECIITDEIAKYFDIPRADISVDRSILDLGLSSIALIQLRRRLQDAFQMGEELHIMAILEDPTVRGIASAVDNLQNAVHTYQPVVTLNSTGAGTPLWLVHPGVGEVLVFLPLGKYLTDRPVYALRARGFGKDEPPFESIEEAVEIYHQSIKKKQPHGPYALAGYSYGSMLAFEVAKILEANGDEVKFLGAFNLPPHIKMRMRQLDYIEVLLSLSFFLHLFDETYAKEISPMLHSVTPDQALKIILDVSNKKRLVEVDMDAAKLDQWAKLAYALQSMARDYEPSGKIRTMDVFCATPLAAVSPSREDWVEKHLSKWGEFVQETPLIHQVQGAHYTMISPENVFGFQKTLKKALKQRGL